MINTIIIAIAILLIMFSFSFFILKNVIKRINDSAKRYFIEKLQEYNYLIDEYEEKLDKMRKEIEEASSKVVEYHKEKQGSIFDSEIEKKLEEMRKFKARQQLKQEELIYDIPTPQYREEPFFDTYKKLKEVFDVDNEKTIKEFIKNYAQNPDLIKYQVLKNFRDQFSAKTIYECLTLENEEQYTLIKEVMDEKVKELITFEQNFKNPNKFTVTQLIDILEEKLKECNPNIYVYVGQKEISYNHINERIRTKFYKNMSEGVIIYYKGKIYDYSI